MNKLELIEKIKANGEWFETNRYVKITKAVELISQLDEPQKVKVPKEFDGWYKQIEQKYKQPDGFKTSAKRFALWKICQYGFGNGFEDVNHKRTSRALSNWVVGHKEDAINAVWNGYEVEEEPKWVVKYKPGNLENNWYFIGFYGGDRTLQPNCANRIDCDTVIKFKDRSKAEAVATLIDGTVEKV